MSWADGLGAVSDELQAMLQRRILEQRYQTEQQQQQFENELKLREAGQADRGLDLRSAELNKPPEPERPMVVGGHLVTPSGQVVFSPPEKPEAPQRPVTLSPGGALVDPSSGRIITSLPDRASKPERSMEDVLAEYEAKKKIDAQYTGSRPSLGAERNTLNYFNRMLQAERDARAVEDQIGNWDAGLSDVPLLPGLLENFLRTESGQKYQQAQRAYTEARLRKESGAAIPQSEFDTDRRTNFRVAGDKPELMRQKRGMRLQTLRGIGNAAGRALQEYYGEGATLDDLLKEFAEQGAGAGRVAQVPMVAPDGRRLMVPPEKVAEMEAAGARRR